MSGAELPLAAIVLAGYSPNEQDLLADYTMGRSKALIPIAGRPMIAYVVDALTSSGYVSRIGIIGMPEEGHSAIPHPVTHIPDQGGMLANAEAGVRYALSLQPPVEGVLIASADLPLLTAEIVDRFVERCLETDHDLYYGVIERSVMETRFPNSHRTYVRLVEGEFAGGDLMMVRAGAMAVNRDLWEQLSSARKSPIRQASMLGGIWPLVKLLARRMRLREAEQRASRALGLRGRVIVCPDAELGMDVDKPFQLEIARAQLEGWRGGIVN